MKINDPKEAEFVYFPRSEMSVDRKLATDVKVPMTFRQFWEETNGGSI